MDSIESGLYLPIRFYVSQTEQDRYKRHSQGVALTELNYPYVDCISLAPFQIMMDVDGAVDMYPSSITLTAICADSGLQTVLPYDADEWNLYYNEDTLWISYLGNDSFSGLLSNGMYYLQLDYTFASGTTGSYYSDLFRIKNCDTTGYDIEEFRVHTTLAGDNKRLVDVNDLRIINS